MKIPLNLWPGTIWPLNPSTLIRLELCICKSNRIINILCTKKSNRVPSRFWNPKGFAALIHRARGAINMLTKTIINSSVGKGRRLQTCELDELSFCGSWSILAQNSNLCISNPHIFSKCGLIRSNQPISTPSWNATHVQEYLNTLKWICWKRGVLNEI